MNLTSKGGRATDPYPVHIPEDDMLEIMKSLDSDCYSLYYYYHTKGKRWEWRDEQIIDDMNWELRKLQRIRKKLIEAGWMDIIKRHGDRFVYLGRNNVSQAAKDRIDWKLPKRREEND